MKLLMKKLLLQPKVRLAFLLVVLISLLALNLATPPINNTENSQAVVALPTFGKSNKELGTYGTQVARAQWEPSGEDIFVEVTPAAQPDLQVQAPEPPAATDPPPAPEPVAPPLPYVAMAKFNNGDKTTVYLRAGGASLPISEGYLLGNGDYKIESISEAMVSIRYLPMNHLHQLSLSGLE